MFDVWGFLDRVGNTNPFLILFFGCVGIGLPILVAVVLAVSSGKKRPPGPQ